ncbi:MAG: ABC transporter permease [Roseiarcus sp.]
MRDAGLPPLVWRLLAFVALLAVIAGVFQWLSPMYLTSDNLHSLFRHMGIQGVTALGLTFVIVVRQFDISFPGIATLCGMTLGFLIANNFSLSASIVGAAGVGVFCGLVNGVSVGVLRLPDVVATIATGSIAYGLSFVYSDGVSISDNFFSSGILDLNDERIAFLDAPVFILAVVAVVVGVVLHMTRFGQSFYATGENRRSAVFSGVRVRAYVIAAYCLCGGLACLGVVLLCASAGDASTSAGGQLLMPAYAAVYLGAALFGMPSVGATLAGTLLMAAMLNGFTLMTVPYYYSDAIVSVVLVSAIAAFNPRLAASLGRLMATPRSQATQAKS